MRHSIGRAYYDRKFREGKTHNEAMRCRKRRLADHVWRIMISDEFFADTISAVVEFGSAETVCGFPQEPALSAVILRSPMWSLCAWLNNTT